jgi:predicted nucleotidyltransferase
MKIVGLVTEYNPFHNGHLYHLEEAKKQTGASHAIAVMSGHFLQRGEPAILDKWTRAQNAVAAGVDLVIELPTLYACNSAEYFAHGAVSLLDQLNCVDDLCFGSEDGHLDAIQDIAAYLVNPPEEFNTLLSSYLKDGLSYPKARSLALESCLGQSFEFKPNNILGIEYVKALYQQESKIQASTIQRIKADYMSTDLNGSIASATAVRKGLKDQQPIENFVPVTTFESLQNEESIFPDQLFPYLMYRLRTTSLDQLKNIHDVNEGLEVRMKEAALKAKSYEDLIERILTKRYTRTRIQRILVKLLLDISKADMKNFGKEKVQYARILAFNKKGQEILNHIKKTAKLDLITNINQVQDDVSYHPLLDLDIKATDVYQLLYKDPNKIYGGKDHLLTPRPHK